MSAIAKILPAFLLSFWFLPFESGAEETITQSDKESVIVLTWQDCVKEAAENHPDLISAREKLNKSIASKAITKSSNLPQISGDLSGRTSKKEGEDETEGYSYGISGRQLLFDGFKTANDIAAASEEVKSARFSYQVTSSNIRLNLRNAFVELLRAQELLQITEDIVRRRKQNLDLVKLRYEAGREHKGAVLTAQANLAQAEFEATQARRNISLAQRKLIKELGWTKKVPIEVRGDFEVTYPAEAPDFESMAEDVPSVRQLIAQKDAVKFGLKSVKADFSPQVYASASAGRNASDWPPDEDEWSVGLSLSLPIFEGGSRMAKVSSARAELVRAEAEERSGRDSVILALEEAFKDLEDSVDNVEVKKKFLDAAQERAKIAYAQYSQGYISFDDWTIIEDDLVSVRKSFLSARAQALIAEGSWIKAKGGVLEYEQE